ncbi:MAG: ABC transporter permease [Acidobacteriota bacterium]|nr:ABC transporter permease [Acidobacteriota bacterium]
MKNLWQDLRYGARMLLKNPGFTAIAVISLALGIGANTAIFSLVNGTLLRRLPVYEPDQLSLVFTGNPGNPFNVASYPDYVEFRDQNRVFDGLLCYGGVTVSLNVEGQNQAGGAAEQISGLIVSGNYFDLLGVRAALGRTFAPDEDQTPEAHPVVVISHGLWQRSFGGDRNVIGRQVTLNGRAFTIIGVAPENFNGIDPGVPREIYAPMMMQALVRPPRGGYSGEMNPDLLKVRGNRWLTLVGRLNPGVSIPEAQAEMSGIAGQQALAHPETNRNRIATLTPVSQGDPTSRGQLISIAVLLAGVVAIVLLIACANVANLLLARASARRKEIAVRLAVGAGRGRLVRQLLTESVLLACLGGAAGSLLALWAIDVLKTTPPPPNLFAFPSDFSVDGRVLAFTVALSVLTGLVFGLAPALQATRADLVPALKDEAVALDQQQRRFNLRNALVVAQVALSFVLLIGAGLFLRSLGAALEIEPGFDAAKILNVPLNVNLLRYTTAQGRQFYQQVAGRVAALPGVEAASVARVGALSGATSTRGLLIEGQQGTDDLVRSEGGSGAGDNPNIINVNVIGPQYFQTMGIPLARGRDFDVRDAEQSPGVVIVNETFAKRHFAGQEPVGKRVSLRGTRGPWLEIVGVARDSKYVTLGEGPTPFAYLPLTQNHETGMVLHVRAASNPLNVAAAVRGEIQSLEKNLPVTNFRPVTELIGASLYAARMGAVLVGVFGLLALALAGVGLYGVMSFTVARRTREIGIRMALGAATGDVMKLVLRDGMTLVAIGGALGLAAAAATTRLLASFLYGISTSDAMTFAGIAVILTAVALLACYIPARRATKVDPMIALRYE